MTFMLLALDEWAVEDWFSDCKMKQIILTSFLGIEWNCDQIKQVSSTHEPKSSNVRWQNVAISLQGAAKIELLSF